MTRDSVALDRVAGVLVGVACGDALGAGYEFGPPLADEVRVWMVGGGSFGWEPGEWTDDTSMAIAIAEVAATGADLRDSSAQDAIVRRWVQWAAEANDVGIQTRSVLQAAADAGTARAATEAATALHKRSGRSGGNGSLMRTAPVAQAYLHDPAAISEAARTISSLTHYDQDAGDACVLWSLAIAHAVLRAEFDLRAGLEFLPTDRRQRWSQLIDEAESRPPRDFDRNPWVVQALQGAWSAIVNTPVPADEPDNGSYPAEHFQLALGAAVRGGHDTDTVAAIAGGLLGARWGVAAVPVAWQRVLHGWPGLRQGDLVELGLAIHRRGEAAEPLDYDYLGMHSSPTVHPHDDGVILGPVNAASGLPTDVDAVVSLCRVDQRHLPPGAVRPENRIAVWLIDSANPAENPHLDFVLDQAAQAVEKLRSEGHTVFLHCAGGRSRTPTVGALVGARARGISPRQALAEVEAVLPDPLVNPLFAERLAQWGAPDRT
ncbi:MAG: ADP-ribosylglycohydrolase family protein [Candidatus Nanopelagicales bacterium]